MADEGSTDHHHPSRIRTEKAATHHRHDDGLREEPQDRTPLSLVLAYCFLGFPFVIEITMAGRDDKLV